MKRIICSLLTLCCVISLFGCGGTSSAYNKAQKALEKGEYEKAAELFESISSYEDSAMLALYSKALLYGEQKEYTKAIEALKFLGVYKDSLQLEEYFSICELAESAAIGDIFSAAERFDAISAYRDSGDRAEECRQSLYDEGVTRRNTGDIDTARWIFKTLGDYKDSKDQLLICDNAEAYSKAEELLRSKNYDGAIAAFKALGDYSDSAERVEKTISEAYSYAETLLAGKDFDGAIAVYKSLENYSDSSKFIAKALEAKKAEAYAAAEALFSQGLFLEAIEAFQELGDYSDSSSRIVDVKDAAYAQAKKYAEQGEYQKAYDIIPTLKGYKDINEILLNNEGLFKLAVQDVLEEYKEQYNVIQFGRYPRTSEADIEPIDWIVQDVKGNKVLLISKLAIDTVPFDTTGKRHVSWADCTLREWLNNDFLNKAFDSSEQESITVTRLVNIEGSGFDAEEAESTEDKVFILSVDELKNYYTYNLSLLTGGTEYAFSKGARELLSNGYGVKGVMCPYWTRHLYSLRSNFYAGVIGPEVWNDVSYESETVGVRPAVWVKLNAEYFNKLAEERVKTEYGK